MQPESGDLKPRRSLTNTLQPVCYQQRHTQIPRQPGVSLQSIRGFCSVFDVKQLLSWSDRRVQTAEFLCVSASPLHCELDAVALLQDLHQCLGVVLRRLLQGDSLGQTVGHHTAGVLLDPLIRHRDQAALPHSLTWTQHNTLNYSRLQAIFDLIISVSNGLSWVHPRPWDSQHLLPHADGNTYCKAQWRLPPPSSSARRCWTERLMELSVSRARRPYSVCWDRLPGLWYGHSLWSRFADMAPLKPNDTSLIWETSSKVKKAKSTRTFQTCSGPKKQRRRRLRTWLLRRNETLWQTLPCKINDLCLWECVWINVKRLQQSD